MTLTKLWLEGCCDFIYVDTMFGPFNRQEWKKFTGHITTKELLDYQSFESNMKSLVIVFTTDFSKTKSGFEIELTATKDTHMIEGINKQAFDCFKINDSI